MPDIRLCCSDGREIANDLHLRGRRRWHVSHNFDNPAGDILCSGDGKEAETETSHCRYEPGNY